MKKPTKLGFADAVRQHGDHWHRAYRDKRGGRRRAFLLASGGNRFHIKECINVVIRARSSFDNRAHVRHEVKMDRDLE